MTDLRLHLRRRQRRRPRASHTPRRQYWYLCVGAAVAVAATLNGVARAALPTRIIKYFIHVYVYTRFGVGQLDSHAKRGFNLLLR